MKRRNPMLYDKEATAGRPKTPAEVRFWQYVYKTENCWFWIGAVLQVGGYGRLRLPDKTVLAHRISWQIHFGNIPEGMDILHKCDTPQCVNPEHLYLGTDEDNIEDCVSKGRCQRNWDEA